MPIANGGGAPFALSPCRSDRERKTSAGEIKKARQLMGTTVAENLLQILIEAGVRRVYGIAGELDDVTDTVMSNWRSLA